MLFWLNKYQILKKFEKDIWGTILYQRKVKNKIVHFFMKRRKFVKRESDFLRLDILNYRVRRKPKSLHKYKLEMRQKIKNFYWNIKLPNLFKLVKKGLKKRGYGSEKIIRYFESRLDAALWRTNWFSSVRFLRQFISHKNILVNNKIITYHSYYLVPGDLVEIRWSLKKKFLFNNLIFNLKKEFLYNKLNWYLDINYKYFFFIFGYYPNDKEVSFPFTKNYLDLVAAFLR